MFPKKETVDQLIELGLNKLNTECFTYDKHENDFWNMFDGFDDHRMDLWMHQVEKYMIGFARGGDVPCRPKEDYIAVMFERDGAEFWFHINCLIFTPYFLDKSYWNEVYVDNNK